MTSVTSFSLLCIMRGESSGHQGESIEAGRVSAMIFLNTNKADHLQHIGNNL